MEINVLCSLKKMWWGLESETAKTLRMGFLAMSLDCPKWAYIECLYWLILTCLFGSLAIHLPPFMWLLFLGALLSFVIAIIYLIWYRLFRSHSQNKTSLCFPSVSTVVPAFYEYFTVWIVSSLICIVLIYLSSTLFYIIIEDSKLGWRRQPLYTDNKANIVVTVITLGVMTYRILLRNNLEGNTLSIYTCFYALRCDRKNAKTYMTDLFCHYIPIKGDKSVYTHEAVRIVLRELGPSNMTVSKLEAILRNIGKCGIQYNGSGENPLRIWERSLSFYEDSTSSPMKTKKSVVR